MSKQKNTVAIRYIKPFGNHKKGDEVTIAKDFAARLVIVRKVAVYAGDPDPVEDETEAPENPVASENENSGKKNKKKKNNTL